METNNKDMGKENKCDYGSCGGGMCSCSNCGASACGSGCCGGHGYKKHRILKKIFWLIALVIIFHLGVEFGELKGELHGSHEGFGTGMIRYSGNDYGFGMMGNKMFNTPTTPTLPTTPQ
jgi:hypothetical protein